MRHLPNVSRSAVTLARRTLFGGTAALSLIASLHAQTFYDPGEPTAQEQQVLWLVNRARANPAEEGQRVAAYMRARAITADGVGRSPDQVATDFGGYAPRPPLAMNAALLAAARAHAAELAARRVLDHVGANGSTAQQRDAAAGYTGFGGTECASEWISLEAMHLGYEADYNNLAHDTNPLGHRNIRMDLITGVLAEVGVGLAVGAPIGYEVEDFGVQLNDGPAFLVGTVYIDANGNGAYDPGEGVAGVTVTVENGARYAVTGAAGGYAVPLVRAADNKPIDGAVAVRLSGLPDGERRATVQVVRLAPLPGMNLEYYGPYRANVALDVRVGDGTNQSPATSTVVGVVAATPTASPVSKGKVVFTRTGGDAWGELSVRYSVGGTAMGGVDYQGLSGSATIPAGQNKVAVKIKVLPGATSGTSVKVKVNAAPGYRKDPASKTAVVTLDAS